MGAGKNQRNSGRSYSCQSGAAQSIAERDGVVAGTVDTINLQLQLAAHCFGTGIVKTSGEKARIDQVRRMNNGIAQLSRRQPATYKQQAHD